MCLRITGKIYMKGTKFRDWLVTNTKKIKVIGYRKNEIAQ